MPAAASETPAAGDQPAEAQAPAPDDVERGTQMVVEKGTQTVVSRGRSVTFSKEADVNGDTRVRREQQDTELNGWNYDKEQVEWQKYHRAFVERVINQHVRDHLNRTRERCNLFILIVSSFMSLAGISSSGVVSGSDTRCGEAGEVDVNVNINNTASAETIRMPGSSSEWVQYLMRYQVFVFAFLSFSVSLVSIIVQMNTPFWKRMDKDGRAHELHLIGIERFYEQSLEMPPETRTPYEEYLAQRKQWEKKAAELPDLTLQPSLVTRAVRRVRRIKPSDYLRGFTWLGYNLNFPNEPAIVDAMLWEFSSGQLGKYTQRRMNAEEYAEYRESFLDQKRAYFVRHHLSDREPACWAVEWIWDLLEYLDCFGCCCCLYGPTRSEHRRLSDQTGCCCPYSSSKSKRSSKIVRRRAESNVPGKDGKRPSYLFTRMGTKKIDMTSCASPQANGQQMSGGV